jgi:hypothetical protein
MEIYKNKLKKAATSILVAGTVLFGMAGPASAANLSYSNVTLGDSRRSATTNHDFVVKAGSASATLRCIQVTYSTDPRTFGAGTAPTGLSTQAPGASLPATVKIQNVNPPTTAASDAFSILTSTNAYSFQLRASATGNNITNADFIRFDIASIVNPSVVSNPTNYYARVELSNSETCAGGSFFDSSVIMFAIVNQDGVSVQATVDPTLTFTVAALNSGVYKSQQTLENSVTNGCASTATAVVFPVLTVNVNATCAQTISTSTNAGNGFIVTIKGDQTSGDFMRSTVGTIPNHTGTNGTPTTWPVANDTPRFGYTTDDGSLQASSARFNSDDTWAGLTNAGNEVQFHGEPATQSNNVAYRVRTGAQTKAGQYAGTVIYVATPLF